MTIWPQYFTISHLSQILPTLQFTSTDDMTQTLQHLHLGDLLGYEDDGSYADRPNDIDILNMRPKDNNTDYNLGGSVYL